MEVIRCEHINKTIHNHPILKDVSLTCESQSITGIIGNNGSGKSVLFKCICGLYKIDSGKIFVNGELKKNGEIVNGLGVLIENPAFIERYSGYQNLEYLYGLNNKVNREYILSVLDEVGLLDAKKKKVSKYSMGMKQRLAIAQAIMENPDILILDEPMNGLDYHGVEQIRSLLLEKKKEGKTIIITSHNKEDIDMLCDRIYMMDMGIVSVK